LAFHVLQEVGEQPAFDEIDGLVDIVGGALVAGRQRPFGGDVTLGGQSHLVQVVAALDAPRRFAGRLDRRQQQRHQHANDGNNYKQLNEGETM
jgi:hypothetical protein